LAKEYRETERLEAENEALKRKLNTVRRHLSRIKSCDKGKQSQLTPKSKTDNLLRKSGIDPDVLPAIRKKLLFAECIGEEIKEAVKYNRATVKRIVSGKIIKKYKMKKTLE
jgi:hypothetical protein